MSTMQVTAVRRPASTSRRIPSFTEGSIPKSSAQRTTLRGAASAPALIPRVAPRAAGAGRGPSSSATRKLGRRLASSKTRPRYSPMIPSERSWTPEKNMMETTMVG